MNEENYEVCEFAHKRCYSRRSAGETVNRVRGHGHYRTNKKGSKQPIRYYFCEYCNKYHLTSERKRRRDNE